MLDVTLPSAPIVRRTFELSGALIAARRIDNAVHTVVVDRERPQAYVQHWPDSLPRCGVYETAVKAQLDRLTIANEQAIVAAHAPTDIDRKRQIEKLLRRDYPRSNRTAFGFHDTLFLRPCERPSQGIRNDYPKPTWNRIRGFASTLRSRSKKTTRTTGAPMTSRKYISSRLGRLLNKRNTSLVLKFKAAYSINSPWTSGKDTYASRRRRGTYRIQM